MAEGVLTLRVILDLLFENNLSFPLNKLCSILQISEQDIFLLFSNYKINYDLDFVVKNNSIHLSAFNINLLDPAFLNKSMPFNLFYFDTISSTNSFVVKNYHSFKNGDVCISEHQSKGRGRLGKSWFSPYGANLYISIFWFFEDLSAFSVNTLGLAVSVSVAECLCDLGVDVKLKWPNDIYLKRKKIAGVLIDTKLTDDGCYAAVGVGINYNLPNNYVVNQPITDIFSNYGNIFSKNHLALSVWRKLSCCLDYYHRSGFGLFYEKWRSFDCLLGERFVSDSDSSSSFIFEGIDKAGNALIRRC